MNQTNSSSPTPGPSPSTTDVWPIDPVSTAGEREAVAGLTFTTGSRGKLEEAARALGVSVEELQVVKVPDLERQMNDYQRGLLVQGRYQEVTEDIARAKVWDAHRVTGRDVTAEDTGLYLAAMDGLPGPCIKDYATPNMLQLLCSIAQRSGNKSATWVVCYAYCDGGGLPDSRYEGHGEPQVRTGVCRGEIAESPRGSTEFGFDCIFIPDPERQKQLWPDQPVRTVGEMSSMEKAQISPRVEALNLIANNPFLSSPTPAVVRFTVAAGRQITSAFKEPVPATHVEAVTRACQQMVAERSSRIREDLRTPAGRRQLVLEGELPERAMDNDSEHPGRVMPHFDIGRLKIVTPESGGLILANGVMRMELLNHPLALEAQLRTRNAGYVPVRAKVVPVIDRALVNDHATAWDDYKLPLHGGHVGDIEWERMAIIMAQGGHSWTSTKTVGSFNVLSSVPAANSAWAIAEAALCGVQTFVPCDGQWAHPDAQEIMIRAAISIVDSHPFSTFGRFNSHKLSNEQTVGEFCKERARRLIGATLKAHESGVAARTEDLMKLGVSGFRVYDAGLQQSIQLSVAAMTAAHRNADMTIWAGQIGDVQQWRECVEAGAHAGIVGVGDGDMCITAQVAAVAANNPGLLYQLVKANLGVPVGADGGVGSRGPVVAALGGAFRMLTGSLTGGTLSLRLVKMSDAGTPRNGTLIDEFPGEASGSTKYRGGLVDALGEAMHVEGVVARYALDPNSPHIARRLWDDSAGFAKALRFEGCDSITQLQHTLRPKVMTLSGNAQSRGDPHARDRENVDVPHVFNPRFETLVGR